MAKKAFNNIRLGIFVLGGLLFLVLMLYMIGRNETMFVKRFELRARFENVQGLVPGNNVRYAGIEVGTVKRVNILNDTLIEVVMRLELKMKKYIRRNAEVSMGTDGLMGNRVINISPVKYPADLVENGDVLTTKRIVDLDEMLETLFQSNNDVSEITAALKETVQRINESTAVWKILNDHTLPMHLRATAMNMHGATEKAQLVMNDLYALTEGVKEGKGSLGALLTDTVFSVQLYDAVDRIKSVGQHADSLALLLSTLSGSIRKDIDSGNGIANALLKDTLMVARVSSSLENIQKGTEAFNQNMEAIKQSFLFRGYFRKLEKRQKKDGF